MDKKKLQTDQQTDTVTPIAPQTRSGGYTCNNTSTMLNSLLDKKILEFIKLKAFAGDKINTTNMTSFMFDREKYIVGKGEHPGFLLFPRCVNPFPNTSL